MYGNFQVFVTDMKLNLEFWKIPPHLRTTREMLKQVNKLFRLILSVN